MLLRLLPLLIPFLLLWPAPAARAQDAGVRRRIDSLETVLRQAPPDTQAVHHLNELAWRFQQTDPPRAATYARRALVLSRRLRFARGEGKALTLRGVIHTIQGQFDSARLIQTQALALRRRLHDRFGEAGVLNNMGVTELYAGNYPAATAAMIASLRIEEQLGDSGRIAEGLVNLGNVFTQLRQYGAAHRYTAQYLRFARDSAGYANGLANLGMITWRLKSDPEAERQLQRATALARRLNEAHALAVAISNLAIVYHEQNRFAEALPLRREGLALFETLGEQQQAAAARLGLGIELAELHDPAALPLLQRGVQEARALGAREELRDGYQALAEAYAQRSDFAPAYAYHRRSQTLGDSLLNETSTEQINELNARFETEKKEARNRIQALELRARALVIRRQTVLAGGLGLALVAALLISAALLGRARARQRAAVAEEAQRQQRAATAAVLEAEERERRRIGADLHDGVGQLLSAAKLNLSGLEHELTTTVGLTTPPAARGLLDNAIDSLDESLREVRSLSHQLVPNALLRQGLGAAVREFVQKVTAPGQLRVELEVVGLEQRLAPALESALYRIIQELVANVVKHARATEVTLQLLHHGPELTVLLEDNGVGFDPAEARTRPDGGIGLRNLGARVELLGGQLYIDSRPGRGTTVTVEIPVPAAA